MTTPANLYCARGDVTKELPLGAITSSGGIAADSPAGTDVITYDGHGLETGDPVVVRALEGSSLPAPLVSGTTYYAIRLSNSAFALSATNPVGAPIDITGAAVSMAIVREPDFDGTIEYYSRWAETFLPAHLVPLTQPIHPLVKGLVADLSAKAMMNHDGKSSATVDAAELAAKAQLERFASGLVLRGAPATARANLAVSNTVPSSGDPRGWGSGRLP